MKNYRQSIEYEKCVAAWAIEHFDFIDITITVNAKIRGVISGRSRQIDVLLEDRFKTNPEARIIIEAKLHSRPVDIEIIEATEAKLRDVNAGHAVVISSGGFTESAIRRSEDLIYLTILDCNQLTEEYSEAYSTCLADSECGKDLLWSIPKMDGAGPGWLMYKYGKCIRCHTFHVRCYDCGSKFYVPDGLTIKCGCDDREWGAIPESESSGHIGAPESTWLMLRISGEFYGLQRKPIGNVTAQVNR